MPRSPGAPPRNQGASLGRPWTLSSHVPAEDHIEPCNEHREQETPEGWAAQSRRNQTPPAALSWPIEYINKKYSIHKAIIVWRPLDQISYQSFRPLWLHPACRKFSCFKWRQARCTGSSLRDSRFPQTTSLRIQPSRLRLCCHRRPNLRDEEAERAHPVMSGPMSLLPTRYWSKVFHFLFPRIPRITETSNRSPIPTAEPIAMPLVCCGTSRYCGFYSCTSLRLAMFQQTSSRSDQ